MVYCSRGYAITAHIRTASGLCGVGNARGISNGQYAICKVVLGCAIVFAVAIGICAGVLGDISYVWGRANHGNATHAHGPHMPGDTQIRVHCTPHNRWSLGRTAAGGGRRMQVTDVEEEDRERVLCKEKEAVGRL